MVPSRYPAADYQADFRQSEAAASVGVCGASRVSIGPGLCFCLSAAGGDWSTKNTFTGSVWTHCLVLKGQQGGATATYCRFFPQFPLDTKSLLVCPPNLGILSVFLSSFLFSSSGESPASRCLPARLPLIPPSGALRR